MNPRTCGASPFPGCDEVVANGLIVFCILVVATIVAVVVGAIIVDAIDKRKRG